MQSCFADAAQPSTIFRCPGMSIDLIAMDSMHAGDLAVFQDALGSLFWIEITCKAWHATKKVGLKSLNWYLGQYEAANRRALSIATNLQMSQIRGDSPGYPTLKAKAAHTRHLAEFGLLLARRHEHGDGGRAAFTFRANHRLAPRVADHRLLVRELFDGMLGYHQACATDPFDPDRCKACIYLVLHQLKSLRDIWCLGMTPDECRPYPSSST